MKKLLLVWHEAGNSAYWDRFRELARHFEVTAIGLQTFSGVKFFPPANAEKFSLRLYAGHFTKHWLSYFSWGALKEAYSASSQTVIYLHQEPHALISFALCLFNRKSPIILDSAVINRRGNFWKFNIFERFVYNRVSFVFPRNEEVSAILISRGCPEYKIRQPLGNGVSNASFYNTNPGAQARLLAAHPSLSELFDGRRMVVGFAGRIWRSKGVGLLAEIAKAGQQGVVVCGPVVDEDLARELTSAGVVVLPPLELSDLRDFYSSIDLFVLPSLPTAGWREQFGRVITESISCGTPAIGSALGAIPKLVGEGATFCAGDVESLQSAINRFAEQSSRSTLLEWQSANVEQNFTWAAIAQHVANASKAHEVGA